MHLIHLNISANPTLHFHSEGIYIRFPAFGMSFSHDRLNCDWKESSEWMSLESALWMEVHWKRVRERERGQHSPFHFYLIWTNKILNIDLIRATVFDPYNSLEKRAFCKAKSEFEWKFNPWCFIYNQMMKWNEIKREREREWPPKIFLKYFLIPGQHVDDPHVQ